MYITKAISINDGWGVLCSNQAAFDSVESVVSSIKFEALERLEKAKAVPQGKIRQMTLAKFIRKSSLASAKRAVSTKRKRERLFNNEVSFDGALSFDLACINAIDKWALVETERAQMAKHCDVSVLVIFDHVPDWLHSPQHNDLDRNGGQFEKSLQHIKQNLIPLYHDRPLVVLGISENSSSTELIELDNPLVGASIERSLEFSPEHYQAGVGILSYFSEILQQKYPDVEAKVKIEQDGHKVRMTVDAPDGSQEVVEEALNNYTLVLAKEIPPESLLEDKLQIHKLKMKLDIAEMEVRNTRDFMMIADSTYKERVGSLEQEIEFMRNSIKDQMQLTHKAHNLIGMQCEREKAVSLAHIENQKITLKSLAESNCQNVILYQALSKLNNMVNTESVDQVEAKEALTVIQRESPSTFDKLQGALEGTMYGVSGNILFQIFQQVASLAVA
ncbi:hypothetical protein AB4391_04475 [Vibrio lentus]|uniref:Uncharacterized protein n=1 Tax=Vibrio lentus TaxID=136468 RepID=A0A2N7KJ15_9VIBR|nr:hypothetical protein [Vibrio lentus]PMM76063.1 hypothetical protein BCT49_22725 [Vibrio lentus]